MQDQTLKDDLSQYVRQNWKKSEILDFIESKYPMYAWSGRTLARRLQCFDIKFKDYEVDIEDVKEAVRREVDGPGQLPVSPKINLQYSQSHAGVLSHPALISL